jgi:hypothetical protein
MLALVDGMSRGVLDSAAFTPEAYAQIAPRMRSQQAALGRLGPVRSFALVADDALVSRVLYYRARYDEARLHWRVVMDEAGRIESVSAR